MSVRPYELPRVSAADPNDAIVLDRNGAPTRSMLLADAVAHVVNEIAAPAVHDHDKLYLNAAHRFGVSSTNTNNAPALNTAVSDIASRGGGYLILPAGILRVEAPVLGASFVSMRGVGMLGTIIEVPQSVSPGGGLSNHPLMYVDCSNFTLRDFGVRGNRAAHPGAVPTTSFNGLYIEGAGAFLIDGVRVYDVENDGIVLTRDPVIGGSNHGIIRRCRVEKCKNGVNAFKGSVGLRIEANVLDLLDINGIMVDDATAADTAAVTSFPHSGVSVGKNYISRWAQNAAGGIGIVSSGGFQCAISENTLRSGGIVGVDAGSSRAASGVVITSGENRHNAMIGAVVAGNMIDGVAGGAGVSVVGARNAVVSGNAMRNLFLWPGSLSGSAINLLQDTAGNSPQKGTTNCTIGPNAIEGNTNTAFAVQIGPGVVGNRLCAQSHAGLAQQEFLVSATAGQGQFDGTGYGVLPVWTAGMRGLQWHNSVDDKLYIATNTGWVVVGTQV